MILMFYKLDQQYLAPFTALPNWVLPSMCITVITATTDKRLYLTYNKNIATKALDRKPSNCKILRRPHHGCKYFQTNKQKNITGSWKQVLQSNYEIHCKNYGF